MFRIAISTLLAIAFASIAITKPIDRHDLVSRHNPHITKVDTLASLSVGNGGFAFTVDVTGLQSFADEYADGIALGTQSDWGWHSFPNTEGYTLADTYESYDTHGRAVDYPALQTSPAGQFLRANPHRLGLGRIGFEIARADGSIATLANIADIDQTLNLWTGVIDSRFSVDGVPVRVQTVCHPKLDLVSAVVTSPLVTNGQLKVVCRFPYGSEYWGPEHEDWTSPEKHHTEIVSRSGNRLRLKRTLDADNYFVDIGCAGNASAAQTGLHRVEIAPKAGGSDHLSVSIRFAASVEPIATPKPADVAKASAAKWRAFWTEGGAIDFSGCADPRAFELERRVVLSQYLTAIQCVSDMPPQETGLTYNSWYGKPHLEMHWWHGVHWALWDRLPNLERTLPWYQSILPKARAIAAQQGYTGARWPKMVGPSGDQGPSTIAPLLVWQQPHPLYYAELCYRQHPDRATLERYRDLVFETAEFMASYAHFDEAKGAFSLGPPLIPAQESHDPHVSSNPPFEMAYWRWGLEVAQQWKERLGLPRDSRWDRVLSQFADYPTIDGAYATTEGHWNNIDHPTVLGAYGAINGPDIDLETMRFTLKQVIDGWNWDHTWGWDYPLVAMTAARVGEPEAAIDALLLDVQKNRYLPNGHNYQDERLRLYLPGNGGLLAAVAMMAAGWDGAPEIPNPGFPQDGNWNVRWENLHPIP